MINRLIITSGLAKFQLKTKPYHNNTFSEQVILDKERIMVTHLKGLEHFSDADQELRKLQTQWTPDGRCDSSCL